MTSERSAETSVTDADSADLQPRLWCPHLSKRARKD